MNIQVVQMLIQDWLFFVFLGNGNLQTLGVHTFLKMQKLVNFNYRGFSVLAKNKVTSEPCHPHYALVNVNPAFFPPPPART